ncbi:hypothetical protein [Paenibacillus daejeonensis]|uniref:hypothetical protein n=1 Tax=Paenibacillus daejeonensis TaxID=135193 RepID=UPI0003761FFD|nr:hypothetical protein [Paenibacillus daejeonensis]
MRRFNTVTIILGVLLVIGIIYTFMNNPSVLVIGIAVFGIIYLLYKFPPDRWFGRKAGGSKHPKIKPSARTAQKMQARSKTPRKNIPFRVIEGGKDDDDLPKYH